MKEKLSAFVDAELNEFEERRLLNELAKDEELRRVWGRYHLIRAALRNEVHTSSSLDLPGRVGAEVGNALVGHIEALPVAAFRGRFVRWAATVAVAASVAAVTIVGLQALHRPGAPSSPPVALEQDGEISGARPYAAKWGAEQPEMESVLNVYLVEHNDFAPTNGMSGMLLPYVRVVAYDRDQ